jgi:hypothetical protein
MAAGVHNAMWKESKMLGELVARTMLSTEDVDAMTPEEREEFDKTVTAVSGVLLHLGSWLEIRQQVYCESAEKSCVVVFGSGSPTVTEHRVFSEPGASDTRAARQLDALVAKNVVQKRYAFCIGLSVNPKTALDVLTMFAFLTTRSLDRERLIAMYVDCEDGSLTINTVMSRRSTRKHLDAPPVPVSLLPKDIVSVIENEADRTNVLSIVSALYMLATDVIDVDTGPILPSNMYIVVVSGFLQLDLDALIDAIERFIPNIKSLVIQKVANDATLELGSSCRLQVELHVRSVTGSPILRSGSKRLRQGSLSDEHDDHFAKRSKVSSSPAEDLLSFSRQSIVS